ncbi:MAG: phosphotransferase family protein [Chloroflexi bacterium]|nr:phosphotransferase family protein [Chloroflexota bacterium]
MNDSETKLLEAIHCVDIWKKKEITYEPGLGGITNNNWKVCVGGEPFFIKIPGKGAGETIDRNNAHMADVIAAKEGIGPKVYYYFEATWVEIFEWLEGYRTLNYGDVFNPVLFHKIIDTIRKFHQHKGTVLPVKKSPFEQTNEMIRLAKEIGGYLPPEIDRMEWLTHQIEDSIGSAGINFVPCHVDHWTANYLYNDDTKDLKLTDFEYASMSDIGWDFSGISTTNYFTEAMDVEWIRTYFGEFDEVQFARMKLFKLLSDISWSMWSSVQITKSSVKSFDYYMWMGTKLTRLRASWNDPRLDYWLNLVKNSPVN